MMEMLNE
jgi:hypothetical protein